MGDGREDLQAGLSATFTRVVCNRVTTPRNVLSMSPASGPARPRHMAGAGPHAERTRWGGRRQATRRPVFDVEAAFEPDFDFEALFADDDASPVEDPPRVRVARHRVAFAVSVTLAALPLLALDNFTATADTPPATTVPDVIETVKARLEPPDRLATSHVSQATITVASIATYDAAPTVAPPATDPPTTTTTTEATTTTSTTQAVAEVAVVAATTTTTDAPPPTTQPLKSPDPSSDATWDELAECETSGNWSANTGNGYYGGLQFAASTWRSVGGTGLPHQHSRATQIEKGKQLQAERGWTPWPTCARKLGWT